jgi:hypothetical protein
VGDRFLVVAEVGRSTRQQSVDDVVGEPCQLAGGAVGVELVVRVPGGADGEDDDFVDSGRQGRAGPVAVEHVDLGGSEGGAEQKGVQRAEEAAVRCDDLEPGRVGPGPDARDQGVVERALGVAQFLGPELGKSPAHR